MSGTSAQWEPHRNRWLGVELAHGVIVAVHPGKSTNRNARATARCFGCGEEHTSELRAMVRASGACRRCADRGRMVDLAGRRHGSRVILGRADPAATYKRVTVQCDCGDVRVVSLCAFYISETCGCSVGDRFREGAARRAGIGKLGGPR